MYSFEKQCEKISKSFGQSAFDEFSALTSNEQRITFLSRSTFNILDQIIIPQADKIPVKSSIKAFEFRNRGNEYFKRGTYNQALIEYTKSCYYYDADELDSNSADGKNKKAISENGLAIAIANRSAALYHLNRYNESLIDIDLSLSKGYPQNLLFKLYERKGDCLKMLNKIKESDEAYNQAMNYLKVSNLDKTKSISNVTAIRKKKQELQNLESTTDTELIERFNYLTRTTKVVPTFSGNTNSLFPSLASCCKVSFREEVGRHVRAVRDIKPGEIVLIEKPFASILLPQQYWMRCNVCLKPTVNSLPCPNCVFVIFCSEECCKKSQESFHRFECKLLGYLKLLDLDKFALLVLRTILTLPADTVMNYTKSKMSSRYSKSRKIILNEKNQYSPDDYNTICDLVTNENKKTTKELFSKSIKSFMLLKLLEQTDYFNEIPAEDLPAVEIELTTQMLNHFLSFPCNAHEIFEIRLSPSSVAASVSSEIGAGIYSTLSLFNHSCDPLVTRVFYGDVCVVRAIGLIKKDAEVTDNYGTVFQMSQLDLRQAHLSQYCFKCTCDACRYDWPLYDETLEVPPTFLCDNCSLPILVALDVHFKCSECSHPQNLRMKKAMLVRSGAKFKRSFSLLLDYKPEEALPGVLEYLTSLAAAVRRPFCEISKAQESLKQCYGFLANCTMI